MMLQAPGMGQKRQMDSMGRVGAEDYSVEFSPPSSLALEGESGDASVTWRRKPDGRICITTFDGISLSPESTEQEPDEDEGAPEDEMEMD